MGLAGCWPLDTETGVARAANATADDRMLEVLHSPCLKLAGPELGMQSRQGCREHSLQLVGGQSYSKGMV